MLSIGLVCFEARLADVALVFSFVTAIARIIEDRVIYDNPWLSVIQGILMGPFTIALTFAFFVRFLRRRALQEALMHIKPDEERYGQSHISYSFSTSNFLSSILSFASSLA